MDNNIGKSARVAVIGYGSWATAIVKILLENIPRVGWFVLEPDDLEYIRRHGTNPYYLREVHFDTSRLDLSSDINAVVEGADVVVVCVPSAYVKVHMANLKASLAEKFVVSAVKGIIPDDHLTVGEYINRQHGVPFDRIGVVTGPCHAEEVALERLSYLTMVCKREADARALGEMFATEYIRVSYSNDIYGAEYATVLKNIYAIGVGIAVGLGYGDNFTAVLISNSAMEMERFMTGTYPAPRDLNASVYLGDLLVTGYSQFSRNRTFGTMIGKGYSVQSVMAEMTMVAEGYYSTACIQQINKQFGIRMPIADAVYRILYEGASPRRTIQQLANELI